MNPRKKHKQTIKLHRTAVRKLCFKMGIPIQGLLHDLSKYSKTEMSVAKYATGNRSPHEVCREVLGYSPSWNHHYHKNKHHWQYWVDEMEKCTSAKMPYKYVIEMFCDMTGASKAYRKAEFKTSDPYDYYKYKSPALQKYMHKESQKLLVTLFEQYQNASSEQEFFNWYKNNKKSLKSLY